MSHAILRFGISLFCQGPPDFISDTEFPTVHGLAGHIQTIVHIMRIPVNPTADSEAKPTAVPL
jgi:hypothetical protein